MNLKRGTTVNSSLKNLRRKTSFGGKVELGEQKWTVLSDTCFRSFSSVQFSCSVVSDSLWPHEPQHARPPSPSSTPRVHPKSCPSSWWCHPAISSSVVPFSSCPQSLPASGSFQWVNSSHEVAKVLEFQLQHHSFQRNPGADLLHNGLVGSRCSPRDLRVFSNTTVQKHQFFGAQLSSQCNSHIHTWPQEKP